MAVMQNILTKHQIYLITLLPLLFGMTSCQPKVEKFDYLVSFNDTINDQWGYKNQKGEIVIPTGQYLRCFTDTFKTYAIVLKPEAGFVTIDRLEIVWYEVFPYDNGPDEPSEGLFRILANKKIGYADSLTGKVVIKPQFDCAWPFEDGVARVSTDCKTQSDGEHTTWVSDNWYFIDKSGNKVEANKGK
jgi:hypothetical protein